MYVKAGRAVMVTTVPMLTTSSIWWTISGSRIFFHCRCYFSRSNSLPVYLVWRYATALNSFHHGLQHLLPRSQTNQEGAGGAWTRSTNTITYRFQPESSPSILTLTQNDSTNPLLIYCSMNPVTDDAAVLEALPTKSWAGTPKTTGISAPISSFEVSSTFWGRAANCLGQTDITIWSNWSRSLCQNCLAGRRQSLNYFVYLQIFKWWLEMPLRGFRDYSTMHYHHLLLGQLQRPRMDSGLNLPYMKTALCIKIFYGSNLPFI